MSSADPIAAAVAALVQANDVRTQKQRLPTHLQPLLNHAMPHLYQSQSADFIASDLWFGTAHTSLATEVSWKCFHADVQGRRIVAIVQANGCGKTKTGLQLAHSFILLPVHFMINAAKSRSLIDDVIREQANLRALLGDNPTLQQVERFSSQCIRLLHLFLLTLISFYDHCIENKLVENSASGRFWMALLLLNNHEAIDKWCRAFFSAHLSEALEENAFKQLRTTILDRERGAKVVFLFDEMHALFDQCRGYCLHSGAEMGRGSVADWLAEQTHTQAGNRTCTDLFHQLRVVMVDHMMRPTVRVGFVTCSTMLRTWEDQFSFTSRGILAEFCRLHSFTHAEIKAAVRTMFNIPEAWLDALEHAEDGSEVPSHQRLSALSRPQFLVEYLERLCESFNADILPDTSEATLHYWLRSTLATATDRAMHRATRQIGDLTATCPSVNDGTGRQVVHLLYAAQRLSGGTLRLGRGCGNNGADLEDIIAKGVACVHGNADRFSISDPICAQALVDCYRTPADRNRAVLSALAQDVDLDQALVSQGNAQTGYLAVRLLAWLSLTGQLHTTAPDQNHPGDSVQWPVFCSAECAGTVLELGLGTNTASEPAVLAAIMSGATNCILLPPRLAGPDLWFRATVNATTYAVAVHAKVENYVYSFAKFLDALVALDPVQMYAASTSAAVRDAWSAHRTELATMPYLRIVFSACGFAEEVQYAVHEYNYERRKAASAGQSASGRFIQLLSLDDIQDAAGPVYDAIKRRFTSEVRATVPAESVTQADRWRELAGLPKKKWSTPALTTHCKVRGIPTYYKKKEELLAALNEHAAEGGVAQRVARLDPRFE